MDKVILWRGHSQVSLRLEENLKDKGIPLDVRITDIDAPTLYSNGHFYLGSCDIEAYTQAH